jgi:WD40 repeat protein
MLSGGDDQTLRLWDTESGHEIRSFTGHQGGVTSVAFSPDGRRLLSGSDDQTLRLWDAESGHEIRSFTGHQGGVWSVAFSPDGCRVLSGSNDQTLRLWDTDSGQQSAPSPAIRVVCGVSPFRPTVDACSPEATTRRCASGIPSRGGNCAPSPDIRVG